MKLKIKRNNLNGAGKLDIVLGIFLTIFALAVLLPFYNAVLVSIVPQSEYLTKSFVLFPSKLDLTSYRYVFGESMIPSGFMVTVFVTVVGTVYSMFFNIIGAYVLTRKFPGRKIFYAFLIIPGILPGGMIPDYLLMRELGLMDKLGALILPGGLSWGIAIVMARFIQGIPYELEESAHLDGASEWTILWKIILPLTMPIIATYSLFTAVAKWNEWFGGMLYMRTASKMPLQTVLRNIIQESTTAFMTLDERRDVKINPESVKMACLVVTIVPVMCIYPFVQRFFVPSLTVGAVKG